MSAPENIPGQPTGPVPEIRAATHAARVRLTADGIPAVLKELPRWVCWRFEVRDGRLTKIPVNPRTNRNAASNDSTTWASFKLAWDHATEEEGLAGIGFMFNGDGIMGMDIDHCLDASGTITPEAHAAVTALSTYTEVSISGHGIHALCRANLPDGKGRRQDSFEFYCRGRFFVITGERWPDTPASIEPRQSEVDDLLARLFPPKRVGLIASAGLRHDSEVLAHAERAKNSATFSKLWEGAWQALGYASQSEADAALLSMLRFWTGGNKDWSFSMFAKSGLHREKWDRADYRELTWGKINSGPVFGDSAPPAIQQPTAPHPPEAFTPRSLTDFYELPIDASKTLLGHRFLCIEGGMLFIGPSGVGKSSASVQQDALWALGRPAFGIEPARPLRILCIQAENDAGDMTEMAVGIMKGLQLTEADREIIRVNTIYLGNKCSTGAAFLAFLTKAVEKFKPDIIRIDPLQAYLGGDPKESELISHFVREGLNPLLETYQCAAIINHHTPKTNHRDTSEWKPSDWMYAGAGAADLTNWARAVLVIDPHDADRTVFRFIAAKRGGRIGWKDEMGATQFDRLFRHARESGTIFWEDVDPLELPLSQDRASKTPDMLLTLVPALKPIAKAVLISKAQAEGIGVNRARGLIEELLAEERLYEWRIARPRTNPTVALARVPQPERELALTK
jgi:hypothetical protein